MVETGYDPTPRSQEERDFFRIIDRDLRDCVAWASLFGMEGAGGMFELSPMEVVGFWWHGMLGCTDVYYSRASH